MTTTLEIDLADILEDKYPNGFHAPADIDIRTFLEFADNDWLHEIEVEDLLAAKRLIGIVWNVKVVLDERPDLTDDEAWIVWQAFQSHFEEVTDPMRATIQQLADDMYPKLKGKAALRAKLARIEERIEGLPEDEATDPASYGSIAAELDCVETLVKGA